jgi:hypothetical protein
MKVLPFVAALTVLAMPLAPKSPAQMAATPAMAAMPACEGIITIARISEITPTGSMEKLMAAVAAHQAWYASHGLSDVIVAGRVLERDPQTHAMTYSDKQVLTLHYEKPNGPPPTHDAAWDAYVKMYNDTSNIKETTVSCIPAAAAPASMK